MLVDLTSKRRISRVTIQLADLCSSPVLKSFLGHLAQAPTAMRFRSSFTKLKSLLGGKVLSLSFSWKRCGVPLIAFQQTQPPKPSPWAERGTSFTWLSSCVWRKLWKEATCRACLVIRCVSGALWYASVNGFAMAFNQLFQLFITLYITMQWR